ncbi:MAG TPA: alpha/beta hydrolase-fold protein [Mucilaginibacter sp.]|nr:alpha/beta hydrolase-fold protein [Mucilaginibacter sp.]
MAAISARSIRNNCIVLGKTNTIKSEILGEKRKIWVYVPPCAKDPASRDQRYPVVYLLDGNSLFASVNGIVQELTGIKGTKECPDMIVVAIPNTNRVRDLTPTKYLYGPEGNKIDDFEASGGGDKFMDFIEQELVPYIDSVYPTSSYKTILGHSLGGLAVMNILVNRPRLFDAYIAIDPSMWWDDKKLLKQAWEVLGSETYRGKSLYLGIANNMPAGMDVQEVRRDTSPQTAHMRSVLELEDLLKITPNNGLKCSFKYYGECDHNSVSPKAGYDALRFLFSYQKQPQPLAGER